MDYGITHNEQSTTAQETALLEGLRARDSAAYACLYDRHAGGVLRFAATRFPGDLSTAEDIVIQTFTAVVRDIRRFDNRKSTLAAWVFGIARRRIQIELRLRRRLKSVPVSTIVSLDTVAESAATHDMASHVLDRLDAQRQVAILVEILLPLELEVLSLQSINQLSAREIAHVIGRSERAVHSLLHRARTKARNVLAEGDTEGKR